MFRNDNGIEIRDRVFFPDDIYNMPILIIVQNQYTKVTSLQATVILLTWSESYILALILQPGLSSQASLYFIIQGINPS